MRAAVLNAIPGQLDIEEVDIGEPGPREVPTGGQPPPSPSGARGAPSKTKPPPSSGPFRKSATALIETP